MIDYIIEGFAGGGETSSTRKKHLRPIMVVGSTPPWPSKMLNSIISFSNLDFTRTDQNLHNLVVISVVIGNYIIRKVLVDQESSADNLYASTLQKIQIPESSLSPYYGHLVGFSRERINVLGVTKLRTIFGTEPNIRTINVRYLVINSRAPYHII